MACRLAADSSFRTAAANLARTAQVKMSHERLRGAVLAEGRAMLAGEKDRGTPPGFDAGDCTVPGTAIARVYGGLDGTMVPTITDAEKKLRRRKVNARRRKSGKKRRPPATLGKGTDQRWKEFKVSSIYDQSRKHMLISVTHGDAAAAGRNLRRDAGRVRAGKADDFVMVADGAEWIRNQIKRQSLHPDATLLDFRHLAEHVHACRKIVFGEDPSNVGTPNVGTPNVGTPGNRWAGEVLHAVKHEGFSAFWSRLADLRQSVRGSRRKRAAVDALMTYAANHEEMMNYPEASACGRDVGSGPTESSCKSATSRLKGRGRRWDPENAEAMSTVSLMYRTGRAKLWWSRQLKAA